MILYGIEAQDGTGVGAIAGAKRSSDAPACQRIFSITYRTCCLMRPACDMSAACVCKGDTGRQGQKQGPPQSTCDGKLETNIIFHVLRASLSESAIAFSRRSHLIMI